MILFTEEQVRQIARDAWPIFDRHGWNYSFPNKTATLTGIQRISRRPNDAELTEVITDLVEKAEHTVNDPDTGDHTVIRSGRFRVDVWRNEFDSVEGTVALELLHGVDSDVVERAFD